MAWVNDTTGALSTWTPTRARAPCSTVSATPSPAGVATRSTAPSTGPAPCSGRMPSTGSASVWTVNALTGGYASAFGYTVPGWTAAHYRPDGTGKGHLLWTRNTGGRSVSGQSTRRPGPTWAPSASTCRAGPPAATSPARTETEAPVDARCLGQRQHLDRRRHDGRLCREPGHGDRWRAVEFSRNNDGTGNLAWVNTTSGAVSVWTIQLSTVPSPAHEATSAGGWRCACFDRWVNPGGTVLRPPDLPW